MKTPDTNHNLRSGVVIAMLLAIGSIATAAESEPTLKETFKDYFKVGTAINRSITSANPGFRRSAEEIGKDIALVKAQFNQIVPENEMKWMSLHPRPGKDGYDWTAADAESSCI